MGYYNVLVPYSTKGILAPLAVLVGITAQAVSAQADARYPSHVGPCASESACLQNDWFDVSVTFYDPNERAWKPAGFTAVDLGHEATLVHFFSPTNLEMLVKVLDGKAINRRFWVFAAAATDLGFRLKVRDTQTGWTNEYHNAIGNRPLAIVDTEAFVHDGRPDLSAADGDVRRYLEENALIAGSLVWRGTDGEGRPYNEWPESLKDKLATAADRLLRGEGTGLPDIMTNRAAGVEDRVERWGYWQTIHSKEDAEDLYAANIAHSLVLEMAALLPWSLKDLSSRELRLLFDSRHFYSYYLTYEGTEGTTGGYQSVWTTPSSPELIWRFIEREGLIGANRRETIVRTVHWARYHLIHWSSSRIDDYDPVVDHWDFPGGPPLALVLTGTTKKSTNEKGHFTAGCHGTNHVLIHVLRALNIPVEYVRDLHHAAPRFPSEGLNLSHGDDPYSSLTQYSHPFAEPFPTSELLISDATYNQWFEPWGPDEDSPNIGRRVTELGVEYLPQWLLRIRCRDIANDLSNADSEVYRPGTAGIGLYWTVAELEAMGFWKRMDAKIARYGGCSNIPPSRYRGLED